MAKKENKPKFNLKDPFLLSLIILVILGGILARIKLKPESKESEIQPWLIGITDSITKIEISDLDSEETSDEDQTTILQRKDGNWIVSSEEGKEADEEKIGQLLQGLEEVKAKEIVSQNEKNHQKYGLEENQAMSLKVYQDENIILHLLIGYPGADYESNFIRLAEEKEVYLSNISLNSFLIQPQWSLEDTQEAFPPISPSFQL